jgi:hypothetical protein
MRALPLPRIWTFALLADLLSTLAVVAVGTGVEGNALPAHLVGRFSALGPFGSHVVALGSISLLLCLFLCIVYRSQHPRVVAYRPLLMLLAVAKIAAASYNCTHLV